MAFLQGGMKVFSETNIAKADFALPLDCFGKTDLRQLVASS